MVKLNLLLFVFFSLLTSPIFANLEINEIMYAPSSYFGSSNEWIELYNNNNESTNISDCLLDENPIAKDVLLPYEYIVLARNIELFNIFYQDIDVIEHSLGLKNDEDSIELLCNDAIESMGYDKSLGAYRNNKTLERRSDSTWEESTQEFGTPGEENSIYDLSSDYEELIISEIFPDPYGKEDALKPQGEWVELYNPSDKTIHLGGLVFKDKDDDNELYVVESKILAKNGLFLFPNEYVVIYRDGDTDFSLNNNGHEEVRLFKDETLIDKVSYSTSISGMGWSNIEGDFYISPPTPGEINIISENCDWFLDLYSENSIYHNTNLDFELVVSRFIGTPENITVYGKIEDSFGDVVKFYSPWIDIEIEDQRVASYTPNLPEGIYQVSFWIEDLNCNDVDDTDNFVTKIFAINPQYKQFDSSLSIEKIYLGSDEKAEWGDQINVKVNIYKGNSTRTAIELWAEKSGNSVSKRSKLNIYEKFQNYTLTLPLQLHPNCEYDQATDGSVTLNLEGLGENIEKKFKVQGLDSDLCKDYEKNHKKNNDLKLELDKLKESIKTTNLSEKLLNSNKISNEDIALNLEKMNTIITKEKIENKGFVIYQSSSEKSKELIPYFLTLVFILLIIIIVFKK